MEALTIQLNGDSTVTAGQRKCRGRRQPGHVVGGSGNTPVLTIERQMHGARGQALDLGLDGCPVATG